jgi:hypothetical protein
MTMPIVMRMRWPEITREQYEAVRKDVNWEGVPPRGAKFHVAYFAHDGFHVVDVWDSAQDFNAFVETRLIPGVQKLGVRTQPEVEILEAHAVFNPAG